MVTQGLLGPLLPGCQPRAGGWHHWRERRGGDTCTCRGPQLPLSPAHLSLAVRLPRLGPLVPLSSQTQGQSQWGPLSRAPSHPCSGVGLCAHPAPGGALYWCPGALLGHNPGKVWETPGCAHPVTKGEWPGSPAVCGFRVFLQTLGSCPQGCSGLTHPGALWPPLIRPLAGGLAQQGAEARAGASGQSWVLWPPGLCLLGICGPPRGFQDEMGRWS